MIGAVELSVHICKSGNLFLLFYIWKFNVICGNLGLACCFDKLQSFMRRWCDEKHYLLRLLCLSE